MQTLQLHKLLEARGHQVTLLPVNLPYRPAFIGKIPVVRAFFRFIHYVWLLFRQLKGQDVVHLMANSGWSFHLYARPAVSIASWYKIPVVINYRGGGAKSFFAVAWSKVRRTFERAEKVVVPSGFLQNVFAEFGFAATVVPNIVDLSVFRFQSPRLTTDSLHIVVTRNLEALYDNETAIWAFKIIADKYQGARLTIAGEGPQRAELEKLAKESGLGDRVKFAGRLGREAMADLYASADIMFNPSRVDNMPNSILEALASGVLVVSTNVGGIPYMVSDRQHALLVPPANPQEMAKAVFSLLENTELAESLAEQGRDLVQAYQPQKVVPLLEAIYREAMT
ncbi:glycosyltransferase family 4 protein [Aliiglaciecola sp. CAU 1673]|uniref:glycosyltransferase family 4 protein n=1 Tax=Aliiglaciecola sp. CAU 1673 TaxID=3032595 RepID=UPI0023DCBB9B|nr:glycosyltransferase family 4 protein [Aliiglaciecola sp. CAU 1673]MDF2177290.1 glycosyltransferase family 4 protein [Aliiglaciecola sp. CAU 1673]